MLWVLLKMKDDEEFLLNVDVCMGMKKDKATGKAVAISIAGFGVTLDEDFKQIAADLIASDDGPAG